MLPQSHVAYTLAASEALKEKLPAFQDIDYRLLVLASMGPDLIDKPLALAYFYRKQGSAVLFAHTLLTHLGLLLYTVWKKPQWWPYTIAFVGHAILDRLWFFKKTWYWPFLGWQFHEWKQENDIREDLSVAYWKAFSRRPDLLRWEFMGALAGIWFIWRNRLYHPQRLIQVVLTGKIPE